MFFGFVEGETYVKMKKPGKKKLMTSNWEGPFLIMKYLDNNGFKEWDEGDRIYVIKVRMKKCGTCLEGIFRSFILHPEVMMIEGLS